MTAPAPIHLAWWNTGLAPLGKSRDGNDRRHAAAGAVLRTLLGSEGADLLALGEITHSDLEACLAMTGKAASGLARRMPGAPPMRATAVAVVYNPDRLTLVEDRLITDTFAGVTFTTGWHLLFAPSGGTDALNVVVVHWPSHIVEQADVLRGRMANSLHRALRDSRDVIIMGDFNDEPFSPALGDGLAAYRDRDLVRMRGDAYYNPFWRLLGEQQHVEHEVHGRVPAGTHFYGSGVETRWFTYDQVVVSSALIRPDAAWRLVEAATRVVVPDTLLTDKGALRRVFDHLPIATALTYTRENVDA